MSRSLNVRADTAGVAALAICESLLIALCELKIVSPVDVGNLLADAAAAHRGVETESDAALHRDAAAIIEDIARRNAAIVRPLGLLREPNE